MLVMSRMRDQSIMIGDDIVISIVEIRGDAGVRHGRIMEIMNLCRKSGVTQYSLTQRIVKEQ